MNHIIKQFYSLLLILAITGCSTIKIETDYDESVDISSLNSFALIHKDQNGSDTLTNARISHALEQNLGEKGYHEVEDERADFLVTFHTAVESKTRIDTDYQSMGRYPYRYGGHMIQTTSTYNYKEARLIVDFLEPSENKIIWRGIAVDYLKKQSTPEERNIYIHKVVNELLETFQHKKEGI